MVRADSSSIAVRMAVLWTGLAAGNRHETVYLFLRAGPYVRMLGGESDSLTYGEKGVLHDWILPRRTPLLQTTLALVLTPYGDR